MEQKNKRTFGHIADEILNLWKTKWGVGLPQSLRGSLPYLRAMWYSMTTDKNELYGCETLETVVLYFLANATSWRGEDAKRIKAELKEMLK